MNTNHSAKHPLILLTGFLGSGKTTFLRSLMQELGSLRVGVSVIINDFENAEVDATLLRQESDHDRPEVTSVSGSCLCCDSSEAFLESVGSIPVADGGVLIVEVNGTTDTIEMIASLTVRPEARLRFWSPIQITVIDAQRWGHRGVHGALEREQLSTATHYYVSKGDMVPAAIYNEVRLRAALGAPRALETTPEQLAAELARIIDEDQGPARVAYSTRARNSMAGGPYSLQMAKSKHHHNAERAFTSMTFRLPRPLWQSQLDLVLTQLSDAVLRVKGLVRLRDDPSTPYSLQHIRPQAATEFIKLQGFDQIIADYQLADIPMTIIIIGVRLPQAEIEAAFAPLLTMDEVPLK